ncbi:hypothetical protein ENSA5_68150 [Enhygromyxa salina]|uniref:Lipoprotein n=1 Tax=Enhygromyxa salina TaxID=215803 RepID=A0A2S9XB53_9BACT|nr:hypothetical protein [Enhygromyxa salina]PRP90078.1 hypothetical protein ENSA5_68150 [Enhygromyxa salina]
MISKLSSRLALAGLMALTAMSACVQEQDYLIVERAIWFDGRDNCVLTGSEATPLAMSVDVKFDTRIGLAFVLTNNQTTNVNSNTGIDDSEIQIESAEVSLSFSGGGVDGNAFEVSVPTNSIPGGSSETLLIQVPASVSASLRTTMSALPAGSYETLEMEVVFKGRRTGQAGNTKIGSVESRPYTFPFEICYGCLEACQPATNCGGEGDEVVCPTETEWAGSCGFAQGVGIFHPACTIPS